MTDENSIPRACADRFTQIEHRLTRREGKLDMLCERERSVADRAWAVFKGVILVAFGWFLRRKS